MNHPQRLSSNPLGAAAKLVSRFSLAIGLIGLGSFGFGRIAEAQVILVPNSMTGEVLICNAQTGSPEGSFFLGMETPSPVNLIDGPDGKLLVSEQGAVQILNGDGSFSSTLVTTNERMRGLFRVGGISDPKVAAAGESQTFLFPVADGAASLDSRLGNEDVVRLGNFVLTSDRDLGCLRVFSLDGSLRSSVLDLGKAAQMSPMRVSGTFRLALAGSMMMDGSEIPVIHLFDAEGNRTAFPVEGASATGVIELGSGNFLVSTSTGVYCYRVDGELLATMVTGAGFAYFEKCSNYQP